MVVEDDAVAAPDFLGRVTAAVQQLNGACWLYLKLWCGIAGPHQLNSACMLRKCRHEGTVHH